LPPTLILETRQTVENTLPLTKQRDPDLNFLFNAPTGFVNRLLQQGTELSVNVVPTSKSDPTYTLNTKSYTIGRYSGVYKNKISLEQNTTGNTIKINAIQLEFSRSLRDEEKLQTMADIVARALHKT